MSQPVGADNDLAALRDQLALLRAEIGKLTKDVARHASVLDGRFATDASTGVGGFARCVVAEGERSAEAVALWAVRQPFLAFVMGVAIGYVGARLHVERVFGPRRP